jgi:hypothetical protein
MVEATPSSPLEVAEPYLLFKLEIIPLDAPPQFWRTAELQLLHPR